MSPDGHLLLPAQLVAELVRQDGEDDVTVRLTSARHQGVVLETVVVRGVVEEVWMNGSISCVLYNLVMTWPSHIDPSLPMRARHWTGPWCLAGRVILSLLSVSYTHLNVTEYHFSTSF